MTDLAPDDGESNIERAYRASVSIHFPNIDDFEMSTRVDIMALRDAASAGRRVCSPEAEPVLREVARIGMLASLSGLPNSRLIHIRFALHLLTMAARSLERGSR